MSFNRVITHPAAGYIEVIFEGHEDWMSAVDTIEKIAAMIDQYGVYRVVLDFSRVDMRVAVAEAPQVAKFFHAFSNHELSFGVIRSHDGRADPTIDAFVENMRTLGHGAEYLGSRAATENWASRQSKSARRAG